MLQRLVKTVGGLPDDAVAEAENALREKTINESRETLLRLVALLDSKNGASTARALMLIQKTAESFSELIATLGTGMIPMLPRRAGLGDNMYTTGLGGMSLGQSPDETFGAQIASQFTSAIKQTNVPSGIQHLVEALATAKESGLTEEAKLIQKRLRKLLGGGDGSETDAAMVPQMDVLLPLVQTTSADSGELLAGDDGEPL